MKTKLPTTFDGLQRIFNPEELRSDSDEGTYIHARELADRLNLNGEDLTCGQGSYLDKLMSAIEIFEGAHYQIA